MSVEKRNQDAFRWMRQAESDLAAARISQDGRKFEWACFQAQQAAEKAVKALWFSLDLDPWGHIARSHSINVSALTRRIILGAVSSER